MIATSCFDGSEVRVLQALKPVVVGLKTLLRPSSELGTGGTNSARYCYAVWLRHLSVLHQHGLSVRPAVIAELGPGDSIGTGLAALISGAETYFALDVVDHTTAGHDLAVFDALVELFRARSPIPNPSEFPLLHPRLASYGFPRETLSEALLERALEPGRLARLRSDITNAHAAAGSVRYFAPWQGRNVVAPGSADLVFSQAALEYVDDLPQTYHALYSWLRPGAAMSHQIDFSAHLGLAQTWNGHWGYSELTWRIIRGRRSFFLNRQPLSAHLDAIEGAGFRLVHVERVQDCTGLRRNQLGPRYRNLPDDDLTTSKAHVLAVKP